METSKHTIRSQMRRRRAAVAPAVAIAAGQAVARHVGGLDEFRTADALIAYAAANNEVPTDALIAVARAAGLPVFLPRMVGAHLLFARYERGDELVQGAFGIGAPLRAPVADVGARPLVVLPLLAFDRRGTRLGRGGGHYDRASRTWPAAATRVGLAYSFQERPILPRDVWDAPLDLVVTEDAVLRCAGDPSRLGGAAAGAAAAEAGR